MPRDRRLWGLVAWLKPGRGEIPYAWECLMNYTWIAPGMVEYFYTTATPNDYLIGCLSGPGYLYPEGRAAGISEEAHRDGA